MFCIMCLRAGSFCNYLKYMDILSHSPGMARIASLEDDPSQGQLIRQVLEGAGYECTLHTEGRTLLTALQAGTPFDLLLLDWHLPELDGEDVVRWVRANMGYGLPVLFLTSRTREEDLVQGLQAGADDYIVKPFRSGELLARVGAFLRRSQAAAPPKAALALGHYVFDPVKRVATLRGEPVALAAKEFDLALLFFRNIGRLLSRDALAASVWNRQVPATSRTLDTHLSNIRQKLQLRPENGMRLSASYALGYRLEYLGGESAGAVSP